MLEEIFYLSWSIRPFLIKLYRKRRISIVIFPNSELSFSSLLSIVSLMKFSISTDWFNKFAPSKSIESKNNKRHKRNWSSRDNFVWNDFLIPRSAAFAIKQRHDPILVAILIKTFNPSLFKESAKVIADNLSISP